MNDDIFVYVFSVIFCVLIIMSWK